MRLYWSCPHWGAHAPVMYGDNALALPLHYPLLRVSAQLSGGPNLEDTLYRKWCFPGSSCLNGVWLVTKTQKGKWSRQENAGPKQDSEQKALPKEAEMRLWECAVDDALSVSALMCLREPQLDHLLLGMTAESTSSPTFSAASTVQTNAGEELNRQVNRSEGPKGRVLEADISVSYCMTTWLC